MKKIMLLIFLFILGSCDIDNKIENLEITDSDDINLIDKI
jgi:hypothetical protein